MALTMRVCVRPYADLGRYFPGCGAVRQVEIPDGASIGDLLTKFGLEAEGKLTIGLNGVLAERNTRLASGDLVDVLVPMAGGS